MSSDAHRHAVPTREFERYATYRGLNIIYEGRSEQMEIRAPDISSRGMFIHIATHFPEGAVLKVEFRLSRSGHMVRTRGEVRYCLPGVGIGVEFVEISPEDAQAIEDEIGIALGY
ncbi:MAG: PilZ domain-containing protein [Acidobacteriia bacterium]|nr:PilZ domain-containing protein [Terriglobia bacterium]